MSHFRSGSSSSAGPRSPSHSDTPQCRICHESAADNPSHPLFHPCRCKGSMAFVHQECLTRWLAIKQSAAHLSSSSSSPPVTRCEICHHPFLFISRLEDSAPSSPSLLDAAVTAASSLSAGAQSLSAYLSFRYLLLLLVLPLCPHLRQHCLSLLPSSPLSLLLYLLQTVSLLIVLCFLLALSLLAAAHLFVCFWNHEIHILLFRMKRSLQAWKKKRKRQQRQQARAPAAAAGPDHAVQGDAPPREQDGREGGEQHEGDGEDGAEPQEEDVWLTRLVESIHVIGGVESGLELLHLAYYHHLVVSVVFLFLPFLLMRSLGLLLSVIPLLSSLPSLSSISHLTLASLFSALNGGLPLLLPASFSSSLLASSPPPFQLPSLLFHFTPDSLSHLHAVLHLSPLLHLSVFYSVAFALILLVPASDSLQLLAASCLSVLLKVSLLITLEFILVPVLMGALVHSAALPLLIPASASLSTAAQSHLLHALSFPVSSLMLHWLLGTTFFVLATSFFRLCIKALRRRVVSRVFSVDARQDVFHEIIATPFPLESYKIARTFGIYSTLCLTTVAAPCYLLWSITAGRGGGWGDVAGLSAALPLRFHCSHPLHWVFAFFVCVLFMWRVWVGTKAERRERRKRGKRLLEWAVARVSRVFGLRDYLLKDEAEKTRDIEERRERRAAMRQRRMMEAADDIDEMDDDDDGDDALLQADDHQHQHEAEDAGADAAQEEDDAELLEDDEEEEIDSDEDTEDEIEQWMQAAEVDHLVMDHAEGADAHHHHHHHHHDQQHGAEHKDQHGEEGEVEADERPQDDDNDAEEVEEGDALELLPAHVAHLHVHHELQPMLNATLARKQRDAEERELEKQERASYSFFGLRLLGTAVCLWIGALLYLLPSFFFPLLIGRLLLQLLPLPFMHSNDIYSLVAGFVIILLLRHLPPLRLPLASSSSPSAVSGLSVLKVVLLSSYFLVLFPLALGLLTQHALLLPFRLSLHQQPLFYLQQEWCVGAVLSLFVGLSMAVFNSLQSLHPLLHPNAAAAELAPQHPPPATPLSFFSSFATWQSHVRWFFTQPLDRTRLVSVVYDLLLPPSHFLVLHLALPYVVVRGLLPLRLLLPMQSLTWGVGSALLRLCFLSSEPGDDAAFTARLMEQAAYRWAFLLVLAGRVGWWLLSSAADWWAAYKALAFERRWGTRRLRNVEDDDEDEDDEEAAEDGEDGQEGEEHKEVAQDVRDQLAAAIVEADGQQAEAKAAEEEEDEEEDEDEKAEEAWKEADELWGEAAPQRPRQDGLSTEAVSR